MHEWPPKRILVAIDFGEASGRACAATAPLAAATGADVTVLHAERVDAPPYFTHEQLDVIEGELQAARGRAVAHTRGFAEAYGLRPGTVRIADTAPVDAILHEADHADLIVLGSHGRRGPSRWWIGSVSERVVRASPVPVLVVHAQDRGSDATELFARILVLPNGRNPDVAMATVTALADRARSAVVGATGQDGPEGIRNGEPRTGGSRTDVVLHGNRESWIEHAEADGCDAASLDRATLVLVPLAAEPRDRKVHDVANALGARCSRRSPRLRCPAAGLRMSPFRVPCISIIQMRLFGFVLLIVTALAVGPAQAQEALTLAEAIAAARADNPAVRAARAEETGAQARAEQATAAWWPRVDFSENWQRGNMPVYVFGSLLSQRQFTEANFAIDALNHPDPLTNYRAAISVQQPLFSSDVVSGRRAATVGQQLAATGRDAVERDLAVEATTAYGQALVAQAGRRAADAAVKAAEEDLRRTEDRRATGLVTDADVLSIQVHLAQMKARAIDAGSQARIAMASLNRVMGRSLDREYVLASVLPTAQAPADFTALESEALAARPEARRASLQEQLAAVEHDAAKMALYPQVGWQGGYEWNGQSFTDRAGGWIVGAEVRLNLFRGFGDRARLAQTTQDLARARAEREAAESAIRLDVRASAMRLDAARARLEVGRTAVAQARESQRIIRDRYENGLGGVTDVLRAAQAVLDAELQQTAAEADVITSAAAFERAVGR